MGAAPARLVDVEGGLASPVSITTPPAIAALVGPRRLSACWSAPAADPPAPAVEAVARVTDAHELAVLRHALDRLKYEEANGCMAPPGLEWWSEA